MTGPGPPRRGGGQHVKLLHPSPLLTLRSPFGHVLGPAQWGGYVIVQLAKPAIYHRWDGTTEDLARIVELPENMRFLP